MPFIRGRPGFGGLVQDQPSLRLQVTRRPPGRRAGWAALLSMRTGPRRGSASHALLSMRTGPRRGSASHALLSMRTGPRRGSASHALLSMRSGPGAERLSGGSECESGRSRRRLLPRALFQDDHSHCEADQCEGPLLLARRQGCRIRVFGRMRPFHLLGSEREKRSALGRTGSGSGVCRPFKLPVRLRCGACPSVEDYLHKEERQRIFTQQDGPLQEGE
nr:uncharacterized protein LOC123855941 [Mirounga angustirostris]